MDGVVCCTANICLQTLMALEDLEENIKNRIKIITFDGSKWFKFLKYPISYIEQPTEEIGKTAVELLLEQISQKVNKIKRSIFLETKLISAKS